MRNKFHQLGASRQRWNSPLSLNTQVRPKTLTLTTNTDTGMRAMHSILEQKPQFSHQIFVLCNSHRIQLLIKHIFKLLHDEKLVKMTQIMVADFAHSQSQLGNLREHQQSLYQRKIMAIVIFVITQQEIQYSLFQSLFKFKDILRAYATNFYALLIFNKTNVSLWLFDNIFWQTISCETSHQWQTSGLVIQCSSCGNTTKREILQVQATRRFRI